MRMTTELLSWLRYGKQFPYVVTECGYYSADVLGSDGKTLYEVETKISKSDFKRDFTHKNKHAIYLNPDTKNSWVPHRMYFSVPEEMQQFALDILKEKNDKYGLIVYSEEARGFMGSGGVKVVKRAKNLHSNPLSQKVLESMVSRMSSDICHLYATTDQCSSLRKLFLEQSERLANLKDIEESLPE